MFKIKFQVLLNNKFNKNPTGILIFFSDYYKFRNELDCELDNVLNNNVNNVNCNQDCDLDCDLDCELDIELKLNTKKKLNILYIIQKDKYISSIDPNDLILDKMRNFKNIFKFKTLSISTYSGKKISQDPHFKCIKNMYNITNGEVTKISSFFSELSVNIQEYSNGKRNGKSIEWNNHDVGVKNWLNDEENGGRFYFWENGNIQSISMWLNGEIDGIEILISQNNKIKSVSKYQKHSLIKYLVYDYKICQYGTSKFWFNLV
jgi:hypothetical protein